MMLNMNETGNIFYDEMMGKLQNMEDTLIDIKNGLLDEENINELFRSIHTIKGSADLLGMLEIVSLAHKVEDLLSEVRDGNIEFTDAICDLFVELKKFIAILVENILNGIELTSDIIDLQAKFEKEIVKYMPSSKIETEQVLVLADSFLVRGKIKEYTHSLGYTTITTANGLDGIKKYKKYNFDIVFVDIDTANINAREMLQEISNINDGVKIILITTAKTTYLIQLAKEIKATAWLLKPIKQDKITILLNKLKG